MGQFFKILGNLAFGVLFAMMFFLWTFANTQTFDPKEIIQYAGLIFAIGVAFAMNKLNADEINKLKNEIDKLKKNNKSNYYGHLLD